MNQNFVFSEVTPFENIVQVFYRDGVPHGFYRSFLLNNNFQVSHQYTVQYMENLGTFSILLK